MKSDNLLLSVLAALSIGVVQFYVISYFWAGMTLYVQHVPWLLSHGISGTLLKTLLFFFDNAVNLMLCLPAACALCALRPRRLALYTVLAVLPAFLWEYRLFFTDPTLFEQWQMFVPGALAAALTLPATVWLARLLIARRAT